MITNIGSVPVYVRTRIVLTAPAVVGPDHDAKAQSLIGFFTGIVFHTPDIQGTHRALASRKVQFTGPLSKESWGRFAQFVDQDGNSFVLVQEAPMPGA